MKALNAKKDKTKGPLFSLSFMDGSCFTLPTGWEDVFVDHYGADADRYPALAERLRFVTGKYIAHQAWPSKFDGIGLEDAPQDDSLYDNPDYYWERWADWSETGREWGGRTITAPTWAEVAEAVLYQSMRSGILQKALNELAKKEGRQAPRVVTPEAFLQELKNNKT